VSTTRVSQRLRAQVLLDADGRCGYCRSSEDITAAPLEIEHVMPEALGGPTRRENLWAACRRCNVLKSDQTEAIDPLTGVMAPIFNPRQQVWAEHFAWNNEGVVVVGRTPTGRATVVALSLNRPLLVRARRLWVEVGWHPPTEPETT